MVAGERVEVRIPFEGESELFYAKANTFSLNPPRAVIEKNVSFFGTTHLPTSPATSARLSNRP